MIGLKVRFSKVMKLHNPVILALDVDDVKSALSFAEQLGPNVGALKVGPRLIFRSGPTLISEISKFAPVFVDHKFLDIPSTMVSAVRAVFDAGAALTTVHGWSGPHALQKLAALELELNKIRPFKILMVTVLTSFSKETMPASMSEVSIKDQVKSLAAMSLEVGLSGFVCSPYEAPMIRSLSQDAYIVTPGVRSISDLADDQSRTATARQAIDNGASALVIGRPILNAASPLEELRNILSTI